MIGQIPKSPANPFFKMSGCDFENPDVLSEPPLRRGKLREAKDCRDLTV
jgi:hypothetical protein